MRNETRHQVARGSRVDVEEFNRLYLIKNVSTLRATYQIRLLAFRAVSEGLTLILRVPKDCKFHPSLLALMQVCGNKILREDY